MPPFSLFGQGAVTQGRGNSLAERTDYELDRALNDLSQGGSPAALDGRNHALVDGNKRLAWHAATVFLALSGEEVDLTHDESFDLVIRVAEGSADVGEIAEALG